MRDWLYRLGVMWLLAWMAWPTYYYITHPDTTPLRQFYDFWYFYLIALVGLAVCFYSKED